MFTLRKMSLLRNYTPILQLSKTNTNLKFRASAPIAWSYMKLRLFHYLELLRYKVIKTCRRTQQRWSSWKSTREGRMNLKLLKNLFVYIFTWSVCKICTLQNVKKKQKKDSQTAHALTFHYTPCSRLYAFGLTPLPSYLRTYFMDGPFTNCLLIFQ